MLKDKLADYLQYNDISDNIKKGLDILSNIDFNSVADGRHDFSEDIYVNIQTYLTKQDADFEAHRKYADIQYIIEGHEKIGVTAYTACKTTVPYDEEKDIEFLTGDGNFIELKSGEFMILYPEDAHKPSISADTTPIKVRKAVVKVKL